MVPDPGFASRARVEATLESLGADVDRWTRELVERSLSESAARFGAMLEYHLGWRDETLERLSIPAPSGKKLRPALALLVCEAAGGATQSASSAAVAVELVHNFSLVHDDIQDRSVSRRHRPTLWTLWGIEQAINAGDALFALAQSALLETPARQLAEMARALNVACLRLSEGQYLDIALQGGHVTPDLATYDAMVSGKTGALFECACQLGALAAEASAAETAAFRLFGRELGIAFQEQDDVLGVWGSEQETGKSAALDVATRKRGLPAVLALANNDAPAWLRNAYSEVGPDLRDDQVKEVIDAMDALGVRVQAEQRLGARFDNARAALATAHAIGPAGEVLRGVAELLLNRRA